MRWFADSILCAYILVLQRIEQRTGLDKHQRDHPNQCHTILSIVRIIICPARLAAKAATPAAAAKGEKAELTKKSHHEDHKFEARKQAAKIDPLSEPQFGPGRLYAAISSRPAQVGG